MKLCPLGHENSDDATRCTTCFRRLEDAAASLEVRVDPPGPLPASAGTTAAVALELLQVGGPASTHDVSVGGAAGAWAQHVPPEVMLSPGRPARLPLQVAVPDGTPGGSYDLHVRVSGGSQKGPPDAGASVVLQVSPAPAADDQQTVTIPPVAPWRPPATGPDRPPVTGPDGPPLRRRPGRLRALLALVAVVLVSGAAAIGWWIGTSAVSVAQAWELGEDDALRELHDIRAEDAAARDAVVGRDGWVVRLSGKCPSLESADLLPDPSLAPEGVGFPDGVPEAYPGGMGAARLLAFHLGLRERWGSDVALLTSADVGLGLPGACGPQDDLWLSLLVEDALLPSAQAGLCWCQSEGLPVGECAVLRGSTGEQVFHSRPVECP